MKAKFAIKSKLKQCEYGLHKMERICNAKYGRTMTQSKRTKNQTEHARMFVLGEHRITKPFTIQNT